MEKRAKLFATQGLALGQHAGVATAAGHVREQARHPYKDLV